MSETSEWRLDEAAAAYYEAHFVPAIFAAWAPLLVAAAGVAPGQRVLDVACGTGVVARGAADVAGDGAVAGLDLDPSMLAVARRQRPGIDWRQGDAGALPFADASFDVVVCQAGLMFMPDPLAALREMRRVLRAPGRLAALVWGPSPGYAAAAALLEQHAGKPVAEIFRAPFSMADPRALPRLLESAGFDAPNTETHQRPARFASVQAFLDTEVEGWVLKGRVDVAALLPHARHCLEPWTGPDGAVAIPMAGHIASATRS